MSFPGSQQNPVDTDYKPYSEGNGILDIRDFIVYFTV